MQYEWSTLFYTNEVVSVMRWTNYFIHPGDNRYYVFSFNKEDHKERFEKALTSENIPYENFEDEELEYGAKYLFGIPRTHINEAMRVNNLLHASIRGPFIKSKTLRWSLLLITGFMIALAILGALSSKAYGQSWELAVQARVSTPFKSVGMEAQEFNEDGLNTTWSPKLGQGFGVRMQYRFKENWTFGTGLLWLRNNYSIEYNYQNDTLGLNSSDTISLLRSSAYRIPFLAETRVPLGLGYYVTAAAGIGLVLMPSDAFVNGSTYDGIQTRDYEAYLGRVKWLSMSMMTELGLEKEPNGEKPGWYIGVYWSSALGNYLWVEQVIESNQYRIVNNGFLNSTLAGIEFRILLK